MNIETPQTAKTAGVKLPGPRRVWISPSLMCADACRAEEEVESLERLGVDFLHFDLMDAHFVPNMPMGLGVIESLRPRTSLPFDVHCMVDKNDWFIEELARMGVDRISIHAESSVHLDRSLSLIRSHGIKAGVALNPATPLTALEYVLDRFDFVLLMTVNPGFAGQKLVPVTLTKIADCQRLFSKRNVNALIEVDGNVSFDNIPKMVRAGADILVAGTSSLFLRGGSREDNMKRLRRAVESGLEETPKNSEEAGDPATGEADLYLSSEDDVVTCCRKETGGEGPDIVVTTCASIEAHEQAVDMVAHRGYVNLFGGLPKSARPMNLLSNTIHYKECFLTGSHGCVPRHHALALKLLEEHVVHVEPLITHHFSLDDIHEAFETMESRQGMKVVVHPHGN